MAFNIGVNVLEVEGSAAPSIVSAPLSVAGFLVMSQRGVLNTPVAMLGIADFAANFGSPIGGVYGAHAVHGFFDNGGTQAFAVRVAGNAANPAAVAGTTLNDRLGAPTLRLVAGNRGRPDPGSWGNALTVVVADHPRATTLVPAQVTSAGAEPFALADRETLVVTVNGGAVPASISFDARTFANIAAATAAEVASAINRQSTLLRAATTPDRRVVLGSGSPGTASRVAVAGTAAAALGFTGGAANSDGGLPAGATSAVLQSTGGLLPGSAVRFDVAGATIAATPIGQVQVGSGINVAVDGAAPFAIVFSAADLPTPAAVTSDQVVAALNRQNRNLFATHLTFDGRLALVSSTYGPGSAIVVTPGAPDASAALGLTGGTVVAGLRHHEALDAVSDQYRMVAWSGTAPALPPNFTRVQSVEFDLAVLSRGVEVERFTSLSMQSALAYFAPSVLNDPSGGSRFASAAAIPANASGPGQNAPAVLAATGSPLLGGSDGGRPADTDFIGDPATRTGLHAFDAVDVQLLASPETTGSQAVALAALAYCEARGDAMFVATGPADADLDAIMAYAGPLRSRKVYGALYWPWIRVVNPLDTAGVVPTIHVPPVGHVLGVYARIADARGIWKAPAGDEALVVGALGVGFDLTDADNTRLVREGGVNAIRAIASSGILVDTSRTLSYDSRWLFVNVRRLFNFVKASLRDSLTWVAQEPNDDALRRRVRFNVVTPFLRGLQAQGAFGSGAADQVFTVKCDETNNPPSEVVLGNFRLEVYFYPVKPAETIVITVGQQPSGATAAER